VRSYLAVLRVRHARPLVVAALVGRLSFAMGTVALVLFVRHATGSFATAGVVSAAAFLANGLLAPVRGRLVDRYGLRRTLPPLAVGYAAALAGLVVLVSAAPANTLAAAGLAAAAGAAAPPLAASMRALWTTLVGQGPALQTAYALDTVLEEALFTLGPLLAGLVAAVNPTAGLLLAAGLGLAGTMAFAASPAAGAWPGRPARQVGWAGAMSGPGMPVLVASLGAVAVAIGVWELGLLAAARSGGTPAMGGVLVALMALGSALGGLWYGAQRWRRPANQRFLILLGLAVLVCAPMAITPSLLLLAVVVIPVGAVLAPVTSTANVLAAELAPAGTLTEAATWVTTATNVMVAAGVALAGALADQVGVSWTLAAATTWVAVGLLVAVAGRGRLAQPAAVAGPAPALTGDGDSPQQRPPP
jgi:MFS family permease